MADPNQAPRRAEAGETIYGRVPGREKPGVSITHGDDALAAMSPEEKDALIKALIQHLRSGPRQSTPPVGNPVEPGMDAKFHEDLTKQGAVHRGGGNYSFERNGELWMMKADGTVARMVDAQARELTPASPIPTPGGGTFVVDPETGQTVQRIKVADGPMEPTMLQALRARLAKMFEDEPVELPDSAVRRIPSS